MIITFIPKIRQLPNEGYVMTGIDGQPYVVNDREEAVPVIGTSGTTIGLRLAHKWRHIESLFERYLRNNLFMGLKCTGEVKTRRGDT